MLGSTLLAAALGAISLAILLAVLSLVSARSGRRSGVAGALASIDRRYSQQATVAVRAGTAAPREVPSWLRSLALRLSPAGFASTLQRRLDLAGNPGGWAPDRILAAKGLGLLALAGLGALYGFRSVGLFILCTGVGGVVGFFLPDLLLYNAGVKRRERIRGALPHALDMLTVCVEAGLGFDSALAQVARNTEGPLAAEFARALQEMQIGASRAQALRAMAIRTPVAELRSFVSAVIQANELGIAITKVLREQSTEMRLRRRQRAEEKAQKVPVKVLFPLIFCLFPALFVILLGPGAISAARVLFGG
ncbi:MAG TPA: type II secretion system F family protein [Streptosporangiaceae bacterium]